MNKITKIFIVVALLVLGVWPATARAEQIDRFDVNISINQDSSIRVVESISYNFESVSRHGIYRDIPVRYKARGGNFALRVSDILVTDENYSPYKFSISNQGQELQIKIGDPDVYVSGLKNYVISYTLRRAVNFFSEHDELYWNATGNGWPVAIGRANVSVALPQQLDLDTVKIECFAGIYGSSAACQRATRVSDSNGQRLVFFQDRLGANEGLTVVVGWPKGLVNQPGFWQNLKDTVLDNWILFLPFLVFFILFYLWHTRGRDPKAARVIVAEYEAPEGLTAAEVGTIYDDRAQTKDVSAAIVELAVKGYLRISKSTRPGFLKDSDDWRLTRLKMENDLASGYQRELMTRLFTYDEAQVLQTASVKTLPIERSISLYHLKDRFYLDLKAIQKQLYESVVLKGYYLKNPDAVRTAYLSVGVLMMVLSFLGGGFLGVYFILSVFTCGLMIVLFSLIMPAKTKKGLEIKEKILGLKEYMNVAEKDRIAFHNAPQKSPERFEKLLPYAMALGVEKEWAKQFEGIYNQPPAWYRDSAGGMFNSVLFVSSLNHFTSTAGTMLASRPHPTAAASGGSGFGGGGFSGGGFGGGGGGSW